MMKKIIFIIGAIGLLYWQKPSLFMQFADKAFDADGQILLFVTKSCGKPCDDAIDYLDRKSVAYELIDANESINLYREYSTRNIVPILVAGEAVNEGYQEREFKETLYSVFGDDILPTREKGLYDPHYYEDGSPRLVMYGTAWCPHCAKARQIFSDKGIRYVEWDVEKDDIAHSRYNKLEPTGYPLIYVGAQRIRGYKDMKSIREALRRG